MEDCFENKVFRTFDLRSNVLPLERIIVVNLHNSLTFSNFVWLLIVENHGRYWHERRKLTAKKTLLRQLENSEIQNSVFKTVGVCGLRNRKFLSTSSNLRTFVLAIEMRVHCGLRLSIARASSACIHLAPQLQCQSKLTRSDLARRELGAQRP